MAMKAQKKGGATAEAFAPKILTESEIRQWISERAYGLYVKRGRIPGHDVEDWLEAEQQVLAELKPKAKPRLRSVG